MHTDARRLAPRGGGRIVRESLAEIMAEPHPYARMNVVRFQGLASRRLSALVTSDGTPPAVSIACRVAPALGPVKNADRAA